MKKTCDDCGQEKDISEFYSSGKHKRQDGTVTQIYKPNCKSCLMVAQRANYLNLWNKYFEAKCSRCGYDKCRSALELHHTDDSKEFTFAARWSISEAKFAEEAKKCIVLCANCHREVHEEMRLGV